MNHWAIVKARFNLVPYLPFRKSCQCFHIIHEICVTYSTETCALVGHLKEMGGRRCEAGSTEGGPAATLWDKTSCWLPNSQVLLPLFPLEMALKSPTLFLSPSWHVKRSSTHWKLNNRLFSLGRAPHPWVWPCIAVTPRANFRLAAGVELCNKSGNIGCFS